MAKLTRVPLRPFAGSALESEVSQFGSVIEGSKLHTLNIEAIQALDSWLSGFSKALISGNRYPSMQEMNGVLKVLSYQGAYALQEGIPEYDSATTYYIGSIVKKTGTFELYGSLTNDNVENALTVDTEWQFLCDLNTIGQNITQIGTSSTASATAEKAVTLSGFVLATGATIQVTFTNANTAVSPTLNVNSTGAKSIYNEGGQIVSATNPAYFPASSTVEFTYDGTNWVYKNKITTNYINGTSQYQQYTNGFLRQSGYVSNNGVQTITFPKSFKDINYTMLTAPRRSDATTALYAPTIYAPSISVSSIQINFDNANNANGGYWEAKGY